MDSKKNEWLFRRLSMRKNSRERNKPKKLLCNEFSETGWKFAGSWDIFLKSYAWYFPPNLMGRYADEDTKYDISMATVPRLKNCQNPPIGGTNPWSTNARRSQGLVCIG